MRLQIFAATIAALSVSACQSPITITPTTDSTTIEQEVIAECQAICGVLPLASDIAQILAAGNPALATATAISSAICSAIAPAHSGARHFRSIVVINGVIVHLIPAR